MSPQVLLILTMKDYFIKGRKISIAHKVNLRQYHDLSLHFDGKGSYSLTKITDEEKEKLKVEKEWVSIEQQAGQLELHARDTTIDSQFFHKRKEKKKKHSNYVGRLGRIWKKMHFQEGPVGSSILLFFLVVCFLEIQTL
eukprot:TRINITY_DN4330_c0_g1_i4.p1 TRINITY_DN4330_c0_g1~~TRINITY_DN4330_c0_g1_i4.p1  ORF type:complete len:139 (-),score=30.54 TRINITY_DN4330_c0_g1_i4:710-1126(-)